WQFFREVMKRSANRVEEGVEKTHVRGWFIVGVLALLAEFGGGAATLHLAHELGESVLVLVVLAVIVTGTAYWMTFEGPYSFYCAESRRAAKTAAERDAASARLRPKAIILDTAEIDPVQRRCRIRVQSQ